MWDVERFFQLIENRTLLSTALRIFLSVICGGVLGAERGKSNQSVGLRTHMLVCLGSALVMLTGQYLFDEYNFGDPARLGAQVISGIGFLGAGSIIVEGNTKIRGLTTAAGLWVAACIGLAIGIGYYSGGIIATLTVYLVISKFRRLSDKITHNDTWFNMYVEFNSMDALLSFRTTVEAFGLQVGEISMNKRHNTRYYNVIVYLKNLKQKNPDDIVNYLKELEGVEDFKCIY